MNSPRTPLERRADRRRETRSPSSADDLLCGRPGHRLRLRARGNPRTIGRPSCAAASSATFSWPIPAVQSRPSASTGAGEAIVAAAITRSGKQRRARDRMRRAARAADRIEAFVSERIGDGGHVEGAAGDRPPLQPSRTAVTRTRVGDVPKVPLRAPIRRAGPASRPRRASRGGRTAAHRRAARRAPPRASRPSTETDSAFKLPNAHARTVSDRR